MTLEGFRRWEGGVDKGRRKRLPGHGGIRAGPKELPVIIQGLAARVSKEQERRTHPEWETKKEGRRVWSG